MELIAFWGWRGGRGWVCEQLSSQEAGQLWDRSEYRVLQEKGEPGGLWLLALFVPVLRAIFSCPINQMVVEVGGTNRVCPTVTALSTLRRQQVFSPARREDNQMDLGISITDHVFLCTLMARKLRTCSLDFLAYVVFITCACSFDLFRKHTILCLPFLLASLS